MRCSTRHAKRLPLCAVLLAAATWQASPAHAVIIEFRTIGTLDIATGSLFGESGETSFDVGFTYDTSLAPSPVFLPDGTTATNSSGGTDTLVGDRYGYSASGITDLDMTFGTRTWSVSDISPRIIATSLPAADIWFDTNLSLGLPDRLWIAATDGDNMVMGGSFTTLDPGSSDPDDRLAQFDDPKRLLVTRLVPSKTVVGLGDSFTATIRTTTVPAPPTALLTLLALAAMVFARERGQ